ncbi:Zinc finger MIZ domain-containing protein 2 [Echinococcus granulosus]|uniref:Zinc finger MIZ domain containing protein 2 n=1 Tax=Echinococcus granulosus TaxID=6210 RepID=A0A068WGG9_ECHGR|nr:Zinc finger MIZ domain-containing protein 2 [Echinococcus granulosus]CDS19209.1 zinc finger MIZ domain containing protein 2 [Echinococcus granulosus]
MALHTGALGGLGQVGGPLENAGGAGGGGGLTSDPPQASTMATAAHPPPFIKYAPTLYAPPGDIYANGGSGSGGLVSYSEESTGQPPPVTPTIQMQQFPPQPQSQRLVQPPTIIDAGYYMQPCWGASPPGPTGPPGAMIGQPQAPPPVQQQQQQQPNFDESLMNNGSVVVVSSTSSSSPTCSNPGGCTVVSGLTVAGGSGGCGDRRLITPPMGPLPPPPSTAPMPGSLYGPRFATVPLYPHNPGATACIPQPSSAAYMPMPPHHHDPTCLTPGFAGAPTMNGQRLYMPSPQSSVGLGPRMPSGGAPLRAAPALPFGYFSLAPPTPEGVTAASMCPTAAPGPFSAPHGPSLLPPDQQGTTGRKTDSTTTKKKRAKTAKSRAAAARGGNGRGTGLGTSANPPPKVVTVGPPSAAGLAGPPPPPQMMGPGMMLPTGVSTPSQPSLWAPRPAGPIMTNGSMLPMAPPPPPSATVTPAVSCALPPKLVGLSMPPLNSVVHTPPTPHQHHPTAGAAAAVVSSIAPPPPQPCPPTVYASPVPHPLPPEQTAERLVCPITNGTVVRPMVLHLDEEQTRQSPNTLQVRTFEFDVSKNHLETIVERPDLDIVVCSHLVHEPLQVCHWPAEAVHIRFNGTIFQLDRTTTVDGQPAHRVCGVKSLCRPSRNVIEVFLSPSRSPPHHFPNYSLKDHRFAVFMAHMPAVSMVLDGLLRRVPEESLSLTKLLITSWRNRQVSGGQDQRPASTTPPPTANQAVVAEISFVCPVFRSRMQIPGRLVGCHHLEVFDMEAYLHREAIWSRLLCPICSNGSPAGLDNLYIDYFLLNIIQLAPKTVSTVQVRSDGFWRLSPPLVWQLPPGIDQWQPIVGPPTQAFAFALQIGPTLLMTQPPQPHPSPFQSQQQQQRPVTINGLEAAGQISGRRSCGTIASPTTAETPSLVYSGLEASSGGLQNFTVNPHHQPSSNRWNTENAAAYSNCSAQVVKLASPNPLSSASAAATALSTEPGVSASTNPVPQSTNCRKRVLSTSSAQCIAVLHPTTQTEGQELPNSMPDLRVRSEAVSSQASLPKSLPTTPTVLKPSPPTSMSKVGNNNLCKRISGNNTNIGGGGSVSGGGIGEGGTQSSTSTSPSAQPPLKRPKVSHRQLTDEEVRWAFDGLSDLNYFDDPELIRFINSLPI